MLATQTGVHCMTSDQKQVKITEISSGLHCNIAQPRRCSVSTEREFAKLREEAGLNDVPLPKVNFRTYIAIFAFMGQCTEGGHDVNFCGAYEEEGESVYVEVQSGKVKGSEGDIPISSFGINYPYCIAIIPRQKTKNVIFIDKEDAETTRERALRESGH